MPEGSVTGRRINVIGTSGAGKTTYAAALAARLGVPHVELDALFWGPEWRETPDEDFFPKVEAAVAQPAWVVDGNYSRCRPLVWAQADTVIYLDYPRYRVFGQVLTRTLRRALKREELWQGNRESLRTAFFSRDSILWWSWSTYGRRRRQYHALFSNPPAEYEHIEFIVFRSPRAAHAWLQSLPASPE